MAGEIADPYAVLGLSRTATADDLKRAYRRLVKAWHPDRYAGSSDTQRLEADRRFKLINAAYIAVGEMLRDKVAAVSTAEQEVAQRSDARIEAIRSVVASAALRLVPNLPRHTYRRVVSAVEALLIDTIAVGDRAFAQGLEVALAEAMDFAALGSSSRGDVLRVLDAAADDLQWRGKGADPQTWQTLLRPLEVALRPQTAAATRSAPAEAPARRQVAQLPLTRHTAQAALALVFAVCLVPALPLAALVRGVVLLAALAAFGYVTFALRDG
jgi:DnaJ-domain-containing protein 1